MLDESEGSEKDQLLGDPDWLSKMQYDTISQRTIRTASLQSPSFSSSMRRKKLEDWVRD